MLTSGNSAPTPAHSSLTFGEGKLVMVTLRGSRTAMARGACSFRTSRAQASSRCGSIVAWATVTPICGTACVTTLAKGCIHLPHPILPPAPTRAQKLLIASGGKPLRRRAVSVKSRGSSQSLRKHQPDSQARPGQDPPRLLALLLPHGTCLYQPDDLPFGDHGVEQVQAPILPLHRAVHIQRIAQPEVGGAPAKEVQTQPGSAFCQPPAPQTRCLPACQRSLGHNRLLSARAALSGPGSRPAHLAWNSLVQRECVMCSMESQRQCV